MIAVPAAAELLPTSGAYEIEVRLELPHLDDVSTPKSVRRCLTAEPRADSHGLVVLSDKNPLVQYPVSAIRRDGASRRFDIAFEDHNAARAQALYEFAAESFRAWIAMNMGGKNMTVKCRLAAAWARARTQARNLEAYPAPSIRARTCAAAEAARASSR